MDDFLKRNKLKLTLMCIVGVVGFFVYLGLGTEWGVGLMIILIPIIATIVFFRFAAVEEATYLDILKGRSDLTEKDPDAEVVKYAPQVNNRREIS